MTNGDIYYYYKLTSNYTYKIYKKKYAADERDLGNIDMCKAFYRKEDCERVVKKLMKTLKEAYAK